MLIVVAVVDVPFLHSLTHSSIHSLTRSFVRSFFHSLSRSLVAWSLLSISAAKQKVRSALTKFAYISQASVLARPARLRAARPLEFPPGSGWMCPIAETDKAPPSAPSSSLHLIFCRPAPSFTLAICHFRLKQMSGCVCSGCVCAGNDGDDGGEPPKR